MKKYDEQKLLNELSKLNPDEMYMALERITNFVKKQLEDERGEAEMRRNLLDSKIQKINGQ